MKTKSVKDVTEQPQAQPGVACSEWLAGINESETKAWDNMRVKEDALQRATEELREATREWARQYSIMREAVKQQMPANVPSSPAAGKRPTNEGKTP